MVCRQIWNMCFLVFKGLIIIFLPNGTLVAIKVWLLIQNIVIYIFLAIFVIYKHPGASLGGYTRPIVKKKNPERGVKMKAVSSYSNTLFSRCLPLPVMIFWFPEPNMRVSNNFSLIFWKKQNKGQVRMKVTNSAYNTSFSRCLPLPVVIFESPNPSWGFLIISLYIWKKNQKGVLNWEQQAQVLTSHSLGASSCPCLFKARVAAKGH